MIISEKSKKIIAEILGYKKFTKQCYNEFTEISLDLLFELADFFGYKIEIKLIKEVNKK